MKFFNYKNRRRLKSLTLCTVMLFSIAVQSVLPTRTVLAVGETSQEDNYPEGDDLDPKDNLEEYVIYRWTPVTSSTLPGAEDDDWHLAMLFRVWKGDIEGPYLNGKVTEDLYLGKKPKYVPEGYDRSNIKTFTSKYKEEVAEGTTHYIKSKYAYGYNDPAVNPFANRFYTADDRDVISIKRVGTSTYRKNADGLGAYEYEIKFKSSNDKYEYYAWGNIDSDDDANLWALTEKDSAALAKTMKDNNYNENYKSTNRFCFIDYGKYTGYDQIKSSLYKWGGLGAIAYYLKNGTSVPTVNVGDKDTFNIVGEINGHDPWLWEENDGTRKNAWWFFRDKKTDDSRFVWFNGEELRYSAFRSSVSLTNHQVMAITKSTYTDGDGKKAAQQGVILPKGKTITINKGCVLSISGSFINNGTIIVNGGTLLVKDGGTVYPFLPGDNPSANGCGSIRCLGGDIIIEKGGAVYGGLADENGAIADFNLDSNSTLINQGLLVYGSLRLGENARVELYEDSYTYGGYYQMAFDIKTEENLKENKYAELSESYAEQGYTLLGSRTTGQTKNQKTGEVSALKTAYFQKVIRLKPDEMLIECNKSLLEGKPDDCKCLFDAYKNIVEEISGSADIDSAEWNTVMESVTGGKFGMRTNSDNMNIRVSEKAHFNDRFAKNDQNITEHISNLTL